MVVNVDPFNGHAGMLDVPQEVIGLSPGETYDVEDILTGARYTWGDRNYVYLDPIGAEPAHVLRVIRRGLPPHEGPAGHTLSPGGDLGRVRGELRHLLGARHARGTVPVRLGRVPARVGTRGAPRADRLHLARLPAGRAAGAAVRLPRLRAAEPERGLRFNPNKVLLEPYTKALGRTLEWSDAMHAYRVGDPRADLSFDDRDNASTASLSAVIDPAFTWGNDRPPRTPWHDTVIYEMHVRGMTMRHPGLPESMRGTFAGVGSDEVIQHLLDLGITAVELMPVHHHAYERHLVEKGLNNYWGYNTTAFFAPNLRYAMHPSPAESVREFRTMVRNLHSAGIEVILDVVYNHTAEGSHLGPTISLRGIDNTAYYRLASENPRYYVDYTGCGNTLNMRHPRVLQLIMDSLRYWITEMHVDGFRFDLASALARELHAVDRLGAFFDIIHQDPVISQVKLIAEPWDLGEGGYQVGNFPVGWAEWNGRYRDAIRRFWKGDGGMVSELATRLAGSSDLYDHSGRRPYASVNFVCCHDGFTLNDLVSYNQKHNEANLEGNADGENHNNSWNCGVEGPTDNAAVVALRERQKRNFLTTVFLSQGVPMLLAGDEMGRTQGGNNNAYCQDNDVSWLQWTLTAEQRDLIRFTQH
ncbi:MAG: glycogen debranching protein GlgX [Vicinamibacterales bacterium]